MPYAKNVISIIYGSVSENGYETLVKFQFFFMVETTSGLILLLFFFMYVHNESIKRSENKVVCQPKTNFYILGFSRWEIQPLRCSNIMYQNEFNNHRSCV